MSDEIPAAGQTPPAPAPEAPPAGGESPPPASESPPVSEPPAGDAPPPAEGEAPPDGEAPAPLTAESITFQVPDGFEVDAELDGEFRAALADPELGLDAARANKLAPALAALHIKAMEKLQAAMTARAEQFRADNLATLKADRDFGGAAFASNAALARGVVERFGETDPAIVDSSGRPVPGGPVKELLVHYGLDTHPLMVRLFHRIAREIGEDQAGPGQPGGGGDQAMSGEDYYKSVFSKSQK